MRPSQRTAVLDAALHLLDRAGGAEISYDATAREAGMTKAGVLYHFGTREELVLGVVEHAARRWEAAMRAGAGGGPDTLSPADRIRAYVDVAVGGDLSTADVAVFADALYRPHHAGPWRSVFAPWFDLDDCPDPDERARLCTARLAADGLWLARATGLFAPGEDGQPAVAAVVTHVRRLLDPDPDTDTDQGGTP